MIKTIIGILRAIMQLLSVLNNTLKISYNPARDNLFIGDMVSFSMPNQNGVVAQVFKLEMDGGYNIAHLKIFFTIKDNRWIKWIGNIPSKSASLAKIEEIDIYEFFKQGMIDPLLIGYMPQYDRNFRVSATNFDKAFIFFDNQKNKNTLLSSIEHSLKKANKRFILFDTEKSTETINTINAYRDFKLPLNIQTLQALYNKHFQYSSIEMQLLFDDLISQIKTFFEKSGEFFVPFNIFKSVVDNATPSIELSLLKNILQNYKDKNLFANTSADFEKFQNILKYPNFYAINLEYVPEEWRFDFMEFVTQSIQNTFIIIGDSSIFQNTNQLSKVIKNSQNKTIISTNYSSPFIGEYLRYAQNLILSRPNTTTVYFPNFNEYLPLLNDEEFIFSGEQTGFIPLILQPVSQTENLAKPERKPQIQEPIKPESPNIPKEQNITPTDINTQQTLQEDLQNAIIEKPKEETPSPQESTSAPPIETTSLEKDEIPSAPVPQESTSAPPIETTSLEKDEIPSAPVPQKSQLEETIQKETPLQESDIVVFEEIPFEEENEEPLQEEILEEVIDEVVDDGFFEDEPEETFEDIENLVKTASTQKKTVTKSQAPRQQVTSSPKPQNKKEPLKQFYEAKEPVPEYQVPQRNTPPKEFKKEDKILHPKYGSGVIKRIVSHGTRNLYKIQFQNGAIKLIDLDIVNVRVIQ